MVKAWKVRELHLNLEQGAIDEEGHELHQLVRVHHLWYLYVRLSEASQGLSSLLNVANLEEKWQFFALADIVGTYLRVECP